MNTIDKNKKQAVIAGAGPAGLTGAYELLKHTDIHPVVFEESGYKAPPLSMTGCWEPPAKNLPQKVPILKRPTA